MYIDHQETRRLLSKYCSKGLQKDMLIHLLELVDTHAKSILPLFKYLISVKNEEEKFSAELRCPQHWVLFLQSLASTSPVCAFVHTSNEVNLLLKKMQAEDYDITRSPESMKLLQQYVPVLFNLIKNLSAYPHTLLSPILHTLLEKAEAPFTDEQIIGNEPPINQSESSELHHLGFFPQLPLVRNRGNYTADGSKYVDTSCNKYSHGHPSLLPGVFTVFCQHG